MRRVRDGEGLDRDLMQHVEVGEGQRGRGGACEMREASERERVWHARRRHKSTHTAHMNTGQHQHNDYFERGAHMCRHIYTIHTRLCEKMFPLIKPQLDINLTFVMSAPKSVAAPSTPRPAVTAVTVSKTLSPGCRLERPSPHRPHQRSAIPQQVMTVPEPMMTILLLLVAGCWLLAAGCCAAAEVSQSKGQGGNLQRCRTNHDGCRTREETLFRASRTPSAQRSAGKVVVADAALMGRSWSWKVAVLAEGAPPAGRSRAGEAPWPKPRPQHA